MVRIILAAVLLLSTLEPGFAETAMSEQQCKASGGAWNVKKGKCQKNEQDGVAAGQNGPPPQEGITITGCVPNSASGDPLKGLNVDKGGKDKGGQLCP